MTRELRRRGRNSPGIGFGFIVVSAQLSAGTGKLSTRQATRLARVTHFSQSAVRPPVTHGTISRPLLLGSRREKGELTAAGRVPMQDYRRGFAFPEVKARPGCTWLEVKPPTFYSPLFSQRRSDAGVRPLARPFSHSGNFADAPSHPLFARAKIFANSRFAKPDRTSRARQAHRYSDIESSREP